MIFVFLSVLGLSGALGLQSLTANGDGGELMGKKVEWRSEWKSSVYRRAVYIEETI